jgi:heat shock protein HtpX
MNYARTALLLAAMTGLFLAIGYMLGGGGGALIAFLIALGMNAWSFWNSDKAVLRMQGARPVTRAEAPELVSMVADLARKGNLPTPAVYIMDTAQPNAFATGRDPENAAVAVTRGLMATCSDEELAGVIAHELAHIKNRDTLIMTVTATIAGAIGFLTQFGMFFGSRRDNPLGMIGTLLVIVLAPMAAMLVQMAISRTREFAADREGAEICGHPEWLASALQLIERQARGMTNPKAQENPATAHLFIINPLRSGGLSGLFRTHPPTAERISRLNAMTPGAVERTATKRPWG